MAFVFQMINASNFEDQLIVGAQLWTHVCAKSSLAPSWIVRLGLKSDNLQTNFKKSSYRIVPWSFLNGTEYGSFISCEKPEN
jgi:hypothetical protein